MATLHLHATADGVEQAWRAALAGGGVVELGLGRATPRELVEAAHAAADPAGMRLGPIGERLVVDAVAEGAGGLFAGIAQSRGLRRSLERTFAALGRAGVAARELEAAARQAGGVAGAHGVEVARRYAAYQKLLGAGLYDEAAVWRAGCRAIAAGAAVPMLAEVDVAETHGIVDWDGAHLVLLDALLARGLAVRVVVPAVAELPAPAARALEPALAALEARHGAHRLERVEVPLGRAAEVDYTEAPTPSGEARQVARRVRDLVDAGVAPEEIAVCAATPERRARLEAALVRYGVPVAERRPPSAADAPPVRIALELLALVDDNVPRERFIELLTSRYVAGEADGPNGRFLPHEVAQAMREAGCTDAAGDAYADRLAAWARGQSKHALRIGRAQTICRHVDDLVELLRTLPAEATLERHATRLRHVLDKLELFQRARGFRRDHVAAATIDETRAIARDQAAMRELEVALADLPRAAARAGLKTTKLSRARFARLLGEILGAARARAGGVRGAAVELGDVGGVAGRRFRHLFACGLIDGELPARPPEDPLLSDDDRVALNRALGRPALPLAARAADQSALAFFGALGAAEAAHLSWTRGDEDGAPALRSPLVEELHVRKQDVVELARDPIPRWRDARTLDELTARVVLEARGDRASRLTAPEPAAASLWPALAGHDPPRLQRLEHLVAVERQRHRFFVGELAAHPYVGQLVDVELLAALAAQRLPGRREEPLSATSLEAWASCPFKFYLKSVLRVRELDEVDDEIDQRALGRLTHQVLERLFRRFADEGRFPLVGAAEELELAEEICDDVIAEWRRTEPLGHPALFAVKERRLRQEVQALLRAEIDAPPAEGCRPTHFERPFGPLPVGQVWLEGKIDRIDVGAARAVVLDYKTGLRRSYAEHLKDEAICVTGWQLPIYARAVRDELGHDVVDAHFYSLREAATTRAVREPVDFAERLAAVHAAMRGGDFAVRPREEACDRCGMEAACRVRQPKQPEDDA